MDRGEATGGHRPSRFIMVSQNRNDPRRLLGVALIDDSPKMTRLFDSIGGFAYHYKGDELFRAWLKNAGFTNERLDDVPSVDANPATPRSCR